MTLPVAGDVPSGVVPPANDSLAAIIQAVVAQLDEQSRKTLYSASISRGGLTVQGGGAIKVKLDNGVEIFYAGPLNFGGVSYQGIIMRRADGTPIFYTRPVNGDPEVIAWRWLDHLNNEILASDVLTGGLAKPYIPLPGVPVLGGSIPMTSNAGYIGSWSTGTVPKQQPYINVRALLRSDSGATGNARFTINGSQVGSVMTITANMFAWVDPQTIALPGDFYDNVVIELEVQRTNASGTVGGVFRGYQRQT